MADPSHWKPVLILLNEPNKPREQAHNKNKFLPWVGFEPTTSWSTVQCLTTGPPPLRLDHYHIDKTRHDTWWRLAKPPKCWITPDIIMWSYKIESRKQPKWINQEQTWHRMKSRSSCSSYVKLTTRPSLQIAIIDSMPIWRTKGVLKWEWTNETLCCKNVYWNVSAEAHLSIASIFFCLNITCRCGTYLTAS